ncbi:MAG: hypothetical protein K1W18_09845, partial [Oscillospiraceae bacterium]
CAVKAACTVWNGGKGGDCIKALPIVMLHNDFFLLRVSRKNTSMFNIIEIIYVVYITYLEKINILF